MNRREAIKGGIAATLTVSTIPQPVNAGTNGIEPLVERYHQTYAEYTAVDYRNEDAFSKVCTQLTDCENALMRFRPNNADQARLKVEAMRNFINTDFALSEEELTALFDGMLWD